MAPLTQTSSVLRAAPDGPGQRPPLLPFRGPPISKLRKIPAAQRLSQQPFQRQGRAGLDHEQAGRDRPPTGPSSERSDVISEQSGRARWRLSRIGPPTAPLRLEPLRYNPGRDARWLLLRHWIGIPRLIQILWALGLVLSVLLRGNSSDPRVQRNLARTLLRPSPILDLASSGRQALSTRPDLIRRDWLDELTRLQDDLQPSAPSLSKRSKRSWGLSRCTV